MPAKGNISPEKINVQNGRNEFKTYLATLIRTFLFLIF